MSAPPPLPRRPGMPVETGAPIGGAPPRLPARPSNPAAPGQPYPPSAAPPPMPPRPGTSGAVGGPPPRPAPPYGGQSAAIAHVPAPFSYARSHVPQGIISPRAAPAVDTQPPTIPNRPTGYNPSASTLSMESSSATRAPPSPYGGTSAGHVAPVATNGVVVQYDQSPYYSSQQPYQQTATSYSVAPAAPGHRPSPQHPSYAAPVTNYAPAPSAERSSGASVPPQAGSTARDEDDASIRELLKETSKDYVQNITQGVSKMLAPQADDGELTEEEKRAAREREKEYERKENEYIAQQKLRILEEEERKRKAAEYGSASSRANVPSSPSVATSDLVIVFTLTGNMKKEYMGKAYAVYIIDVKWNESSWTVYRRYKQFSDFNSQAKKASWTFSYALPPKKIQGNLKDQFIEQRQRELHKYLIAVSEKAASMMSNKKARLALLRFFAPTQVGDKSPSKLPFDLSELV